MTSIAVTFALPAESSEFLRRLGNKTRADRNSVSIVSGTIEDRAIEVLHTGVGEKICRERIGKFLEGAEFHVLISTGFAGGLNDQLQVNDLLLAKNFTTIDLKQVQSSLSGLPVRTADMLTLPALIDSREKRERIARESGAAAVDMETEFIARACAEHGIPLLSVRVITDTPSLAFPAPPEKLFDVQQQRTHIGVLARYFLAHPKRIAGLVQFARRIAYARRNLANAIFAMVAAIYVNRLDDSRKPPLSHRHSAGSGH
jgi:nucleoside phosphorylase